MTDLAGLKATLLAEWDRATREATVAGPGEAMLQALPQERPPRGGLAIGEGVDPATRRRRLELRVHAADGPDYARAQALARRAELEGVGALLRVFKARPALPPHRAIPAAPPMLGGRRQPLHLGVSVAHESGSAGTLGAFVRLSDDTLGIVSCSHVLARAYRKRVRQRDAIQQPGRPEGVVPNNRIGELTEHFSLLEPSKADNLYAAIARLDENVAKQVVGNVLPHTECVPNKLRGRELGRPMTDAEIEPGMAVAKIGRTTGFTCGRVSLVRVDNFRLRLGSGESYTFGSVVEVAGPDGKSFTDNGDSGSLVFTVADLRPIGVHFCAAPLQDGQMRSYLVPWWRIGDRFPVQLA